MRDVALCLLLSAAACCLLSALRARLRLSLGRWGHCVLTEVPADPLESRPPSARERAGGGPARVAVAAIQPTAPVAGPNTTADAAAGAALALAPSKVRWLHIPKTGTSFIYVLVAWACPSAMQPDCGIPVGTVGRVCAELGHLNCAGHWVMGVGAFQAAQGRFVSVFRKPEQRTISHYLMRVNAHKNTQMQDFIKEVSGCQAKALIGQGCIVPYELTDADIQEAVRRLQVGFAFVGILEEWAQMVCLFHKMFGSNCRADEAIQIRRSKARVSGAIDKDGNYDTAILNGFTDKADTRVYDVAAEVFHDNMRKYGGRPSPGGCETFCS